MSETADFDSPLRRETSSEVRGLVVLLEELLARLDEQPTTSAVVADLVDAIREVRRMEERLFERATYYEGLAAEERKRYRDLFDRAPDAYIVTSSSGLILHANAAASELLERR